MVNPLAAANAYASAAKAFSPAASLAKSALTQGASGTGTPDFTSLIKDALKSTAATGAQADKQAAAAVAGKADIVDVVTAVAESEAAIETLVAVRDRVIAAYEDIMRMPI